MKPKEKAIELVESFMLWKFQKCELSKKQAKKCALIAVNEIIKITGAKYWYDVKHEIELL